MCHLQTKCGWQIIYFEEFYTVVVCNKDEKVVVTSSDEMAIECVPLYTDFYLHLLYTVYMNKGQFFH